MVFFEVLIHNGYRNKINNQSKKERKKESGIWKPTSVCMKGKKHTSYQPQNPAQNRWCWKAKLQRKAGGEVPVCRSSLDKFNQCLRGTQALGLLKPPGDYKAQAQVRSVGPAPPPTKQPWSSHWTPERSICRVSSSNTVPSFRETFKARSFPAHSVYWLTLIVLTGIKSPLVPQGDLLLKKIISFFAL